MNRQRLIEYFLQNIEINIRRAKLLHEDKDEYKYDYAKLSDLPISKWESKCLTEMFPRHEIDAAIKRWKPLDKNLNGDKKIINAAKKGDISAAIYIWVTKVRDVVAQGFWKFLGPNQRIRKQRIENGELGVYLALAWNAMTDGKGNEDVFYVGKENKREDKDYVGDKSMFERFNTSLYKSGTIWKAFRKIFRELLKNVTTAYNNKANLGGITGLKGSIARGTLGKDEGIAHQSYDATFDDVDAVGGRNEVGFVDDVADNFEKEEMTREFFELWKKFSKDDDLLDESSGISAAKVFASVVGESDATVTSLAERWRVRPVAIKAKIEQAVKIMNQYGITNKELMNAIETIGNDKLAKYLDFSYGKTKTSGKTIAQKKPVPKSSSSDYNKNYYARMKAEGRIPQKKRK